MLRVDQDQHYQKEQEELEMLSKQLNKTKKLLSMMSLQAHMLQVDQATQYNPFTVDMIKNAREVCEKCGVTIKGEN